MTTFKKTHKLSLFMEEYFIFKILSRLKMSANLLFESAIFHPLLKIQGKKMFPECLCKGQTLTGENSDF